MNGDRPLILTVLLDKKSFSFFNTLRKTHFPPALNFLDAHLTLFHQLPPNKPSINDDLKTWCREQAVLSLQVTEVKSVGKGVAYKIDCPSLVSLHKKMQRRWWSWLSPQDRQTLWPHVTVQNKVSPDEAKQTLALLQESFRPFTAQAPGFSLWIYEGGPWRFVRNYLFLPPA